METHFPNFNNAHSKLARQRVVTDLRTLARDAEDLLKATAGDMGDKAKEARVRLTAAVANARTTCDDLTRQGIEGAKIAAQKTDVAIRQHPYHAAGIALAAGVLLGVLLRRK